MSEPPHSPHVPLAEFLERGSDDGSVADDTVTPDSHVRQVTAHDAFGHNHSLQTSKNRGSLIGRFSCCILLQNMQTQNVLFNSNLNFTFPFRIIF